MAAKPKRTLNEDYAYLEELGLVGEIKTRIQNLAIARLDMGNLQDFA